MYSMNIVKFNDTELTRAKVGDEISDKDLELYNKYFRGRWCWAIRMSDVFLIRPDDDITGIIPGIVPEDYTLLERFGYEEMEEREDELDNPLPRTEDGSILKLNLVDFMKWVSKIDSPAYMNTEYFTAQNALVDGNGELSMTLIRRYRAQVAAILYNGVQNMALDFCDKKVSMLEYYIYDMTDSVTSTIGMFTKGVTTTSASSCGCGGSHGSVQVNPTTGVVMNTLTQLGQVGCGCTSAMVGTSDLMQMISSCDIIKEYRKLMKSYMVSTFGDLDFWKYVTEKYKVAIQRIIAYTQAVIDTGLSIFAGDNKKLDLNYNCCKASSDRNGLYSNYVYDLKNIIEAFKLIEAEDYSKLTFIRSNLLKFTDYYEYMQWNEDNIMVYPGDERWIDVNMKY